MPRAWRGGGTRTSVAHPEAHPYLIALRGRLLAVGGLHHPCDVDA